MPAKAVLPELAGTRTDGTAHREFGLAPLRRIVGEPGQRRTDQRAMHGPVGLVNAHGPGGLDLGGIFGYHFGFCVGHEDGVI